MQPQSSDHLYLLPESPIPNPGTKSQAHPQRNQQDCRSSGASSRRRDRGETYNGGCTTDLLLRGPRRSAPRTPVPEQWVPHGHEGWQLVRHYLLCPAMTSSLEPTAMMMTVYQCFVLQRFPCWGSLLQADSSYHSSHYQSTSFVMVRTILLCERGPRLERQTPKALLIN